MQFKLLKDHAGVLIVAAADDLGSFYDIVHDVNDRSPVILDKEGLFLGLAYDIRKAIEGHRYVEAPRRRPGGNEIVGFEILWPTLIVQTCMLRTALGFIDHGKRHQVLAYSLEAIIQEAISQCFPKRHMEIGRACSLLDPLHPFLETKAPSRIEHWYRWTKVQRETRLVELLESLQPGFETMHSYGSKGHASGRMSPAAWDQEDFSDESPAGPKH
jgi:hypothetical protein